jgi:hypothetical protein
MVIFHGYVKSPDGKYQDINHLNLKNAAHILVCHFVRSTVDLLLELVLGCDHPGSLNVRSSLP